MDAATVAGALIAANAAADFAFNTWARFQNVDVEGPAEEVAKVKELQAGVRARNLQVQALPVYEAPPAT